MVLWQENQPMDTTQCDEWLAERVKLSLNQRRPEFCKLSVWADFGTIELSGEIGSFYLRQLAISIAKHVAGVLHVRDEMHVPLFLELPKRACEVAVMEPHYPGLRLNRTL
jgi:osmotically-inducible protein OsmY